MKLFKKVLAISVAVLTCASILSFSAFATGEESAEAVDTSSVAEIESAPSEENDTEVTSSEETETEATSSDETETEEVSSESTETNEVSSEESVSSEEQSESEVSSEQEITSSEGTESSGDANNTVDGDENSENTESAITGVIENTESNTGNPGNATTGETESNTEEIESTTENVESEIRLEPDVPYYGTVSEDWSGADVTVNVSSKTETPKNEPVVQKDIFDFRSVAIKAMIITTLIALICLCGLIFINVKYRNSVKAEGEEPKKKLKATKRASKKPRA